MNRDGASSHRPPPPPPRISSDPNNPVNLNKNLINGDSKSLAENLPVSVTHFSPATNGVGLEKETIFTEENGMDGTATHVNGLIDSTPKAKNTNPFLTNSSESSPDNEPSAVFRSQSRKENNNYENVRMFPVQGETTSSGATLSLPSSTRLVGLTHLVPLKVDRQVETIHSWTLMEALATTGKTTT